MSDLTHSHGLPIQNQSGLPVARLGIGLVFSAGVTFGLFLLMQALVAYDENVDIKVVEVRNIELVQDLQETPPRETEREIEKPPEVEAPPPEVPDIEVNVNPDAINTTVGRVSRNSTLDLASVNLGPSSDGDYLPLVRVQPQYPRRAQERGIQGYVIVSLTVSADGTVPPESIEIIEAEPKGYFERSAKKAAEKFKYKPKVVNGKAQEVSGVQYRFTFELAE